jgi:hypothetical protein
MLLDKISPPAKTLRPVTIKEFLGLRLAIKLNDLENLYLYLRLCNRISEESLTEKLSELISAGLSGPQLAEAFRNGFNH